MPARSAKSLAAEAAYRARLAELGMMLLEPEWLGAMRSHRVRCAAGHEITHRPHDVCASKSHCRVCSGKDPATAEAAFRARAAELGVMILEPKYLGQLKPHRVRFACGHESASRPADIRKGGGFCRDCRERDPRMAAMRARRAGVAEARFRARVAELGGVVLEPVWLGSEVPHRARCAAGHECTPRPDNISQGQGICPTCARNSPEASEARFRARVAELGGVVLEPVWLGNEARHRVRCAEGHITAPLPHNVYDVPFRGKILCRGICRVCSGNDSATAEAAFREAVAELGGVVLEPEWLGVATPHWVRCAAGHECRPRPSWITSGHAGLCRVCGGHDPETAAAAFRARVAELGGVLLESGYLGAVLQHRVRCPVGHETTCTPNYLKRGGALCRVCSGRTWDVFYVVTHQSLPRFKFGISSGTGAPRLAVHARYGYVNMVRLATGLPGTAAPDAERAAKSALALAGERPVQGREYYDISALATVLDVADPYLLGDGC
jgi:hypothetical protein